MGQRGGSRNRCCRAIWKLVWNPFLLQLVKSHSLETPALDYSVAEAGVPGTQMEITEQDVDWAVPLGPPLWKGGGGEGEAGVRSGWRRSWTRAPARRRPPPRSWWALELGGPFSCRRCAQGAWPFFPASISHWIWAALGKVA